MIINTGEYTYRLTDSAPREVIHSIQSIYGTQATNQQDQAVDFTVSLRTQALLRRLIRPQITFYSDQQNPFKPMPLAQAYPVLEWGMNWCIAAHDFNRFIVHSAVLEKEGKAIMFPAAPGSGKSTLTAYLSQNGWNLYSDEMAIIDFNTNLVSPMYRPISLKNNSIDLVKKWFPNGTLSATAKGTQKGDVALFKGIDWQTYQDLEKAELIGVVFPKYKPDTDLTIFSMNKTQGFEQLAANAFNYNIVGHHGFHTVAKVIESSVQFELHYNDVEAVNHFLLEEILK